MLEKTRRIFGDKLNPLYLLPTRNKLIEHASNHYLNIVLQFINRLMHYLLLYVKFLINYNSLRCQTFYDRGGRRAGIFMLDRSFFFHVSRKPFFFTHQVDQFIFDTYMRQTKFVKDLFAKFKQIFIKRRLVELKLYKKR
jgi:hypothetical protein